MPVMDMASVSVTGLDVSGYQVNTCSISLRLTATIR